MPTIGEVLAQARAALKQALTLDDREAGLEAHVLVGHALQRSRAYLLAHRDEVLGAERLERCQTLLRRRRGGEPMAYILGQREFFGLNLEVTPDVLIPRPDTELLVEFALAHLPEQQPREVLDLGTGSGAVAIALARQRPNARLTAIDRSPAALAVAQRNARRLGTANIRFLAGDWFGALAPGRGFDLIVGNPPYVAQDDPHLCGLHHEPLAALVSGRDGLDAIRSIVRDAPRHLRPGAALLLEHGYDQGEACRELFRKAGFRDVGSARDLAGLERVTQGIRS